MCLHPQNMDEDLNRFAFIGAFAPNSISFSVYIIGDINANVSENQMAQFCQDNRLLRITYMH